MKASQFKASFKDMLNQAVKRASEERALYEIFIEYTDNHIIIRAEYENTQSLVAILAFDNFKNSNELLIQIIADLAFWAADHDYNSPLELWYKKKTKGLEKEAA